MDALDKTREVIKNLKVVNKENDKLISFIGKSFNEARSKLSKEENEQVDKVLQEKAAEMGKLNNIDPNKILGIAKKWRS